MKFKVGDVVWCIDKENNNGMYNITSYHRKCVVEDVDSICDELYVRVLDKKYGDDEHCWWVDAKFFDFVKTNGKVV